MSKAIAVVEDDESIREMLRYYFQSVGYAVRAYESGEALFAGEEGLGLPALYILDIMLPGMDGLEILRRLREGRDTAATGYSPGGTWNWTPPPGRYTRPESRWS